MQWEALWFYEHGGVKESLIFSNHGVCNMLNKLHETLRSNHPTIVANYINVSVIQFKTTLLLHLSFSTLFLLWGIDGWWDEYTCSPIANPANGVLPHRPPADVTQSLVKGVWDEAAAPHSRPALKRCVRTRSEHVTSHLSRTAAAYIELHFHLYQILHTSGKLDKLCPSLLPSI